MNSTDLKARVKSFWCEDALPVMFDYLRIPNKSPAFDPEWKQNGHMDAAVQLYHDAAVRLLSETNGATVEIVRLEKRTPILFIDLPATAAGADAHAPILFYGHLDKQPESSGWSEGFGPWIPVLKDGRLYGRGSGDDGYAMFGALGAILAVDEQNLPRGRCLILIEACEESGSFDLPAYLEYLQERIATPSLIICLDSGCENYDQLWVTTSLRGQVSGRLRVDVLEENVHSGVASGIVPSSFRILRSLLSRLEDEETGDIMPEAFHVDVPLERIEQAKAAAAALGKSIWSELPFAGATTPISHDGAELLLNRSWRPALAMIGLDGVPPFDAAANVLRPFTAAKISLRLPPTVSAQDAGVGLRKLFEHDPPYGARVSFEVEKAGSGWNAAPFPAWLTAALELGSRIAFGEGVGMSGSGGSIPLMGILATMFPAAQFVITGVLGPGSNAHGPDEFLDVATAEGVTSAVAVMIAAESEHSSKPLNRFG